MPFGGSYQRGVPSLTSSSLSSYLPNDDADDVLLLDALLHGMSCAHVLLPWRAFSPLNAAFLEGAAILVELPALVDVWPGRS